MRERSGSRQPRAQRSSCIEYNYSKDVSSEFDEFRVDTHLLPTAFLILVIYYLGEFLHFMGGDAHSTTTGAAPDVPHHETASTGPHPRVENTVDNTHETGTSGTTPQTTCVYFTSTERDPFRTSEEGHRVIQIPNDIRRWYPLRGSTSPGLAATGILELGSPKHLRKRPSEQRHLVHHRTLE